MFSFLHGAWRSIEGVYFSRNGTRGENQEAKDLLLYDIEELTITRERKG